MRTVIAISLAAACAVGALTCDAVPEVSFVEDGGAIAAPTSSGSQAADPVVSTDAGTTRDASSTTQKDAGIDATTVTCVPDAGEICCGTHVCVGCSPTDCNKCNCTTPTDVCCPAAGASVKCKAAGNVPICG
jgi:hypothetical protein